MAVLITSDEVFTFNDGNSCNWIRTGIIKNAFTNQELIVLK